MDHFDLPSVATPQESSPTKPRVSKAQAEPSAMDVAASDNSLLDRMRDEARARCEAADELLLSIARENRHPDFGEVQLLIAGGIGADEIRRELARARRVLEAQAIAGTKETREQLAKALSEARAAHDEARERIEAQIAELQRELSGFAQAERRVASQVEACEAAIEELRKSVPRFIAEPAIRARGLAKTIEAERRCYLETRCHELRLLIGNPAEDPNVVAHCRRLPATDDCRAKQDPRTGQFRVSREAWRRKEQEYRDELSAIEPEFEQLASALDERLAQVRGMLDFYVK